MSDAVETKQEQPQEVEASAVDAVVIRLEHAIKVQEAELRRCRKKAREWGVRASALNTSVKMMRKVLNEQTGE